MSYHFYPCGGRENFLKKGRQYSPQLLAPMDPGKMSTVNSGWNDPVLMKLPFVDHRNEPKWDSPTVNVLPSADSARALSARPFGSTKKPQLDNPPPMLPRTPLQSTGARSEHWYSDPIHGVFTNQVPEAKNRWTTSNRSVFRPRDGVQNSGVSARVLERLQASSNGSVSPSEHAKAYVRSCPLYDRPLPLPLPLRSCCALVITFHRPCRSPTRHRSPRSLACLDVPPSCAALLPTHISSSPASCLSPLVFSPRLTRVLRVPAAYACAWQLSRSQHCWERVNGPDY